LLDSTIAFVDLCTVYLGDRLGLYRALDRAGSATAGELAGATGTDERYAREWLEQQAEAGFVRVAGAPIPPTRVQDLLGRPCRGRMPGYPNLHDLPGLVSHHEEDVQRLEED